jgi:DNA-binding MarR family transcriptional regulator
MAMERSTLSRNIALLERKELVLCQEADKDNGRLCSVTEEGRMLWDKLRPEWRKMQDGMQTLPSALDWEPMVKFC